MSEDIKQVAYGENALQIAQVLGNLNLNHHHYHIQVLERSPFLEFHERRNALVATLRDYDRELTDINAGNWYDGIVRGMFALFALFALGFCVIPALAITADVNNAQANDILLMIIWFGLPIGAALYFLIEHKAKYDVKIQEKSKVERKKNNAQTQVKELDKEIENLLRRAHK